MEAARHTGAMPALPTRSIASPATVAAALAVWMGPVTLAWGEGSELPDGSVPVPALPFVDTGDTSDNLNDSDAFDGAGCPFSDSTAPDVFYAFTPDRDLSVRIELCESAYDTKLYVLNSALELVACADDGCSSSGGGLFRSVLTQVDLIGGQTYHIAVDGFGTESGAYTLEIEEIVPPPPCFVACDANGIDESEPCGASVNSGCDGVGDAFTGIDCGDVVCATSQEGDADWYRLSLTAPRISVTMRIESQVALTAGYVPTIVPGSGDCNALALATLTAVPECAATDVVICLGCCEPIPPGDYFFRVAAADGARIACDVNDRYQIEFICAQAAPVERVPCCELGDVNLSTDVAFDDLVILLSHWGPLKGGGGCEDGDLDEDGIVGFADLITVLSRWGPCPCPQ